MRTILIQKIIYCEETTIGTFTEHTVGAQKMLIEPWLMGLSGLSASL